MSSALRPVSNNLVKARYVATLPWCVLLCVASIVSAVWLSWWFYIAAGFFAFLGLWLLWLIPLQVKNLGWLETEDELLISKGKYWHNFTVVPYGRIQFVDVTAGPIAKLFGLKTVELHTASSTSDSEIQGLPATEADALRDRLAVKARERMSGL